MRSALIYNTGGGKEHRDIHGYDDVLCTHEVSMRRWGAARDEWMINWGMSKFHTLFWTESICLEDEWCVGFNPKLSLLLYGHCSRSVNRYSRPRRDEIPLNRSQQNQPSDATCLLLSNKFNLIIRNHLQTHFPPQPTTIFSICTNRCIICLYLSRCPQSGDKLIESANGLHHFS